MFLLFFAVIMTGLVLRPDACFGTNLSAPSYILLYFGYVHVSRDIFFSMIIPSLLLGSVVWFTHMLIKF